MNKVDIATSLLNNRVTPDIIADALDCTVDSILDLRNDLGIIAEDDMNEAMARLAWRAYEMAMHILEEGSYPSRLAIIRMMLSSMRGLMTSKTPKQMEQLISRFESAIEMETPDDLSELPEAFELEEDAPT